MGAVSKEQIRYYGYYSNKSRGLRKKANSDNKIHSLLETDISKKQFRKNWLVVSLRFATLLAMQPGSD